MTPTPRPVVLDCDTGTDDAVAIMLAALHPQLDLRGVTAVWGNVDVEHTVDNTLRVLDHVGRDDVPVFRGAAGPLSTAPDMQQRRRVLPTTLPLPPSRRAAEDRPAVEWLVETLRESTEPMTLVATGPLTTVATALAADRRLVGAVDELVVMGGGHAVANVTPSADRNIWSDARAADTVLGAGFERLVMITLDATYQATVDPARHADLRGLGTPASTATADLLDERARLQTAAVPGTLVHDALAVAYLVAPEVVSLQPLHVEIETAAALTYGRTVIDVHRIDARPPNAHVALTADAAAFHQVLLDTLG